MNQLESYASDGDDVAFFAFCCFYTLRVGPCLLHLRCTLLTVTPSDKQSVQKLRAENFFRVTIFIPPTLLNRSFTHALILTGSKEFDAHGIAGYEGASSRVVHGEGRVEDLVLVQ